VLTPTPTTTSAPSASGFKVTFIDVGQGDSELISVGSHNLLIDGGKSGTPIMQRLQALGVTDLGAVMATHPDADHPRRHVIARARAGGTEQRREQRLDRDAHRRRQRERPV